MFSAFLLQFALVSPIHQHMKKFVKIITTVTSCITLLTNCFHWMCKFSNHAKWCLEGMMYLVDILV